MTNSMRKARGMQKECIREKREKTWERREKLDFQFFYIE